MNISDAHMSPHSPNVWKLSYWDNLKDSIRQVFKFAVKMKVDAILWSGDQFHLKTPARNPLYFLSEVCYLLDETGDIPHYCIGGNHDYGKGSLEGLKGQPLEVLLAAGRYVLLDQEELLIKTSTGHAVRVAGDSYTHSRADGAVEKKREGADHLVTLAHFWFGQATGEFFGEPMYGPDYLSKGETDTYVIGHHHADQGVVRKDGKAYVVVGSITRTGGHATDLDRKPAATYLRWTPVGGMEIKVVRPKVTPIEECLDLEARAAVKQEEKEMEEFIDSLKESTVGASDPKEALKELNLSQVVHDRAKKYLEEAETK